MTDKTLQERLRFELCRIADEECYDFGSHQLMMLRQDEARELRSYLDAQEARIKALEGALRPFVCDCRETHCKNYETECVNYRARALLGEK